MKAISVKQPWASMIVSGEKTIETRSWATKYRGPLLICSSKSPAGQGPAGKALATCILGDITPFHLDDSHAACCSAEGGYSWHLVNVRPIVPFKICGSQGIFHVPTGQMEYCEAPPQTRSLFARPGPMPPHAAGSDTSMNAARCKRALSSRQRGIVFDALRSQGGRGATTEELATMLDMTGSSVRPRLWELRGKNRKDPLPVQVADSGQRRQTKSGCYATVWIAIEFAAGGTEAVR